MGALDFLRRENDKKADPFNLLKQDHRTVEELFKQLEEETGDRNQLFRQLKSELELHTQIEETIFYPALKNDEETRDIILEAFEEHKGVKTLLEEMDALSKQDERWDAKLKVLKENVEHHVEEEEGEMFQKAKDVLSEEEQEKLGEQMLRQKEKATGTGQPGKERKSRTAESRAQRASSGRQTQERKSTQQKKRRKSSTKQSVSLSGSRNRSQQSRGQQARSQSSPARKRQKAQRSTKRVVARKTSKKRSR